MSLHLPRPYPDEIVGSMLYRAHKLLGLERRQFFKHLTGNYGIRVHSRSNTAYKWIARAYGYSFEEFLYAHTLLRYPLLGLRDADREALFSQLSGDRGIYERLTKSAVAGEFCYRFCPRCVADELAKYGEAYWHRMHQLSAVEVCVTHQVELYWTGQSLLQTILLPSPTDVEPCENRFGSNFEMSVKLDIAQASANALQGAFASTWSDIASTESRLNAQSPHTRQLAQSFELFYGRAFLFKYGCSAPSFRTEFDPKGRNVRHRVSSSTLRKILLDVFFRRCGR